VDSADANANAQLSPGCLICRGDLYLCQWLEGAARAINGYYDSILQDDRPLEVTRRIGGGENGQRALSGDGRLRDDPAQKFGLDKAEVMQAR